MHFTLRVKVDAGTPTDVIDGAHVYVEMETLDDLELVLPELADLYAEAADEGVGTAFLDAHVNRAYNLEGGRETKRQTATREAVANLRMARDNVQRMWDALHAHSDTLASALADIDQAIRFLTGEEVPS